MSVSFSRCAARIGAGVVGGALLTLLPAPPVFAACALPQGTKTPIRCTYTGVGIAFSIEHAGAAGTAVPVAIRGIATGSGGVGVRGVATDRDGIGVAGLNTGVSGHAGAFRISNTANLSPAVSVRTDAGAPTGDPSYALRVVNTGNGVGGHFAYDNDTQDAAGTAVFAVNSSGPTQTRCTGGSPCGHHGSAGVFEITNSNNADEALAVSTNAAAGTAVLASAKGPGSNGIAVSAADDTNGGGTAVYGVSRRGKSAVFIGGAGNPKGSVYFDGGGSWNFSSDRRLKDHFAEADPATILDQLGAMPVYYYRSKGAILPTRYLGPTAQDFKSAFALGESDTSINEANALGVALAAAKGLLNRVKADEAEIAALQAQLTAARAAVAKIGAEEARLTRLEAALAALRPSRSVSSNGAAVADIVR